MQKIVVTAILFLSVACALNDRPIIGIVTAPVGNLFVSYGKTFFDGAYVRWIESAGGRVVPFPYDATPTQVEELFKSVNGILFTGGSLSLLPNTTYYKTAHHIFELTIQANQKGDYFPLWGTCMGFQLLSILGADDRNILEENFDSENLPLPLDFTAKAKSSRLFGKAPKEIYDIFMNENVTINLHHDGVAPQTYSSNSKLASIYDLLSTNVDRKGRPFGSSLEGKTLPIYATQFHPERNANDWALNELTQHTSHAILVSQYLSNFFVNEARKSNHRFSSVDLEYKSLIYSYNPIYTASFPENFPDTQTYVFPF